jgi:hypothetical protein
MMMRATMRARERTLLLALARHYHASEQSCRERAAAGNMPDDMVLTTRGRAEAYALVAANLESWARGIDPLPT